MVSYLLNIRTGWSLHTGYGLLRW